MCDFRGWGGGGVVFIKIYVLERAGTPFSRGTGGAPFVCSGAVETRRHVMMTFVPVCLSLMFQQSVAALLTHFLSPCHT